MHFLPSAWIGSTQHALTFFPSVIVGRLFDIGYFRLPFAAGSLLVIIGAFVAPECKVYWQFMLCQGLGVGIDCGLMFCFVTHWWEKRRGLALGLASGGGGGGAALGGTVFPILIR
ncbi:hypothetical protein B0H11DRAFT_1724929 [Mycena galericulata]|nr:hypothetical protein B0H11DRAFT_1724929 [Mycena galericulata]